jgi:hypothetical protein
MFGFSILKLIISNTKTYYFYGLLHRPVIKITMTPSKIRLEQSRPPSYGLLLKYIVNCLLSFTQPRVNSMNTNDSKDTSETTCCNLSCVTLNMYHLSPVITSCVGRDYCRKVIITVHSCCFEIKYSEVFFRPIRCAVFKVVSMLGTDYSQVRITECTYVLLTSVYIILAIFFRYSCVLLSYLSMYFNIP